MDNIPNWVIVLLFLATSPLWFPPAFFLSVLLVGIVGTVVGAAALAGAALYDMGSRTLRRLRRK